MHLPKPPLAAEGFVALDRLSPRTAKILRRLGIRLSDVGRYAARDLLMENGIGGKTLAELTRACILAGFEPPIDYRAFPLAWAAAEEARWEVQSRPAVDVPQDRTDDIPEDVLSDFRIEDLLSALERAIARIGDPRMETIARCRILPSEFATLDELGRRFGVTRENIRLIELRALRRMRNGWQNDRLLSGLAREFNAGHASFENAVLHLNALIARVAPGDIADPVTIALVGAVGDPEILGIIDRKLVAEARRVIAIVRKAHLLEIATSDRSPREYDGTGEVQVPRSERDRMLAGEPYDPNAPDLQAELAATQR
ncbi:sigma factor-like helix-turn-helix DNA-binding protein [Microvirga massiliensis]|uniref:sigma factor-like helix-turn-helix DNA-binding protein n=1 Tax=Microvirga massiliensis TaxID=1033741 RepID=UPI0007C736EC